MRLPDSKPQKQNPEAKEAVMLGVGLDNQDDQTRITRGENFYLYGGSEQTHEIMQETAIRVNESLDQKGKRLSDLENREFLDLVMDVSEKIGVKRP